MLDLLEEKGNSPVAANCRLQPRPVIKDRLWWAKASWRQQFHPPGKYSYKLMNCFVSLKARSAKPFKASWYGPENLTIISCICAHSFSLLRRRRVLCPTGMTLRFLKISRMKRAIMGFVFSLPGRATTVRVHSSMNSKKACVFLTPSPSFFKPAKSRWTTSNSIFEFPAAMSYHPRFA